MSADGVVSTTSDSDCAKTAELNPASTIAVMRTYLAAVLLTVDSLLPSRCFLQRKAAARDCGQNQSSNAALAHVSAGGHRRFRDLVRFLQAESGAAKRFRSSGSGKSLLLSDL